MRCKVILSSNFAVEIISELEKVDKDYILILLKEFDSYEEARTYMLSDDCVYSSYFVVDIANLIMVIPKRDIGKYDNFTILKAFITIDKAREYRDECNTYLS